MTQVRRYNNCDKASVLQLLDQLGLTLSPVIGTDEIPGSFWGDDEAGLIKSEIFVRGDTPLHSILHEACHYVCMDSQRKLQLHTNAGGSQAEENAVCYLQILLADFLPDMGREKMFADMDAWGYSFRLGSARAWFEQDAEDARQWLEKNDLLELADQLAHAHGATLSE